MYDNVLEIKRTSEYMNEYLKIEKKQSNLIFILSKCNVIFKTSVFQKLNTSIM